MRPSHPVRHLTSLRKSRLCSVALRAGEVVAWRGRATTPDDPLWTASPELQRAFENSVDYWEARA